MQIFTSDIYIKKGLAEKTRTQVNCRQNLRSIPKKRDVYDARWQGRDIILKVFKDYKGFINLKKEWKGLCRLKRREIAGPEPLFYGKTSDGNWALAESKIPDAMDLGKHLASVQSGNDTDMLLDKFIDFIASMNEKGIYQADLHAGNFLISGQTIYALDPAEIIFRKKPLSTRRSVHQLAILVASRGINSGSASASCLQTYCRSRNWDCSIQLSSDFFKILNKVKKKGIKRQQAKMLRNSSSSLCLKKHPYKAVFDKSFIQTRQDADNFVKNIDHLMESSKNLKNGKTAYICKSKHNGRSIIIKRYNNKGLVYSIRHTIKKSRAFWNWVHSKRLKSLGISTPETFGFVEKKKGPFIYRSYIITEYIEGKNLRSVLNDSSISKARRKDILDYSRNIVHRLHQNFITHGDLKHTNIIIRDGHPVFIDLDGMIVHKFSFLAKIKISRDLARFNRSLR